MPRNVTVTFSDGSVHTYQNAPDDITPDQVSSRAQKEFGLSVVALDGGRKSTSSRPTNPSSMSPVGSALRIMGQAGFEPAPRQQESESGGIGSALTDIGMKAFDMLPAGLKAGVAGTAGLFVRAQSGASARDAAKDEGFIDRSGSMLERGWQGTAGGIARAAGTIAPGSVGATIRQSARTLEDSASAPIAGEKTWDDLKANPTIAGFGQYVVEQGLVSLPEMALLATPGGVAVSATGRAGNIAQNRAQNDGREDASLSDLAIAAPFAGASAALDKVGLEGIFKTPGANFATRIGRAAGIEAGTEAIQGGIEGIGGSIGTQAGVDWQQVGDDALAGAVAGGGMGGGIRAGVEIASGIGKRITAKGKREQLRDGDVSILSDEDRASPIPDDMIAAGKAGMIEAEAESIEAAVLQKAGMPGIGSQIAYEIPGKPPIMGTVEGAFNEVLDGERVAGIIIRTADGKILRDHFDDIADAGAVVRPVAPEDFTAAADAIDAQLRAGAQAPVPLAPATASLQPPVLAQDQISTPSSAANRFDMGRYMAKNRRAESGGNDQAKAATSSASGRYQFTDGTWLQYHARVFGNTGETREQILAKKRDGAVQDRLMMELTSDNAKALRGAGLPVNDANLYLAHFLGIGGALKLLRAGPNAPLSEAIDAKQIAANKAVFKGRQTAGDVIAWAAAKMGQPVDPASMAGGAAMPQGQATEYADVDFGTARRAPVAPIEIRTEERDEVITTARDRDVKVRYGVVEARDLVASNTPDGRVNPNYPADMQPRDRTRASSQMQIQQISSKLRPYWLGRTFRPDDGAPVISPDGVVESGNGRTIAIQQVYEQGGPKAEEYRRFVETQGIDTTGMQQPVLVRLRTEQMAPEEARQFAREANMATSLGMAPTEQAFADSDALPEGIMTLYQGGDVDAAANRDFVRRYMDSVMSPGEAANLRRADGSPNPRAFARIRNAMLARAYDNPRLVENLSESNDSNIVAIGGALTDLAGMWSKMRQEIAGGQIAPEHDITANLNEAIEIVERSRREGRPLVDLVNQREMFTGETTNPVTEAVLRLLFNRPDFTKPAGRKRVRERLQAYLDDVSRQRLDQGNLLDEPAAPDVAGAVRAARGMEGYEDATAPVAAAATEAAEQPANKPGASSAGPSAPAGGEQDARPGRESVPPQRGEQARSVSTGQAAPAQGASPATASPDGAVATAPSIAGPKIDDEWTAFAPSSGTLGIPRADMPQVKAEHRGALVNFLNARGIEHQEETVDPASLKPTQAEFSPAKVQKAKEYEGGNRAILVSADNHVVDGHHQWMAARDDGEQIRIIRLDAPIKRLLEVVPEMPSATTAEGATEASAPTKPDSANLFEPVDLPIRTLKESMGSDVPLDRYTSRLWRETNASQAKDVIPGEYDNLGGMAGYEFFMADNPDLALGQGDNKGVLLEFDSAGLIGKVNRKKPGWQAGFLAGTGTEYLANGRGAGPLQSALRAVRVRPEAKTQSGWKYTLQPALNRLEKRGWIKVSGDGYVDYVRPDLAVGAVTEAAPTPAPAQPDMLGGPTADERRQALERRGNEPMRGRGEQRPAGSDGGLFDTAAPQQADLLDAASPAAEPAPETDVTNIAEQVPDAEREARNRRLLDQAVPASDGQAFKITSSRSPGVVRLVMTPELARREALSIAQSSGQFDEQFDAIMAYTGGNATFGPVSIEFGPMENLTGVTPAGQGAATTPEGGAQQPEDAPEAETPPDGQQQRPARRSRARRQSGGAQPIEDAGEKIGGARKDQWAERGLSVADLDGMSEGEAFQYVTKDQVWPKPDYAKMVEDGVDPTAAAMLKLMRDRLAAKPRVDSAEGRRAYVEMMALLREEYGKVKTADDMRAARDRVVHERIGWPRGYGMTTSVTPEMRAMLFSVYKGRREPFSASNDRLKARKMVDSGFPAPQAPWASRYEVLTKRQGEWFVYRRGGYSAKAGPFPTIAEAEAAAAQAYADERAAKKDDKGQPVRPYLDVIERTGADVRSGRDIDSQDFIDSFGFRGVEFGNWLAGDERQRSVNLAFEALHDLAATLKIPAEALSLGGKLGLAFGSRGKGKAAAHYEPGKLVINLTKMSGAGSLAHEWGHALDHYFGELDRPETSAGAPRGASGWYRQTDSRIRDLANLRPEMAAAFDKLIKALFKQEWTRAVAVRDMELRLENLRARRERVTAKEPDMIKMLDGAIESVARDLATARDETKPLPVLRNVETSFYRNAKRLSGKSGADGYWARPTEMFARAFEAFVFDRIKEQGERSDYLVQGVEPDRYAGEQYKGNPYPAGPERDAINQAFSELFEQMDVRETPRGPELFSIEDGEILPTDPLVELEGDEIGVPDGAEIDEVRSAAQRWYRANLLSKSAKSANGWTIAFNLRGMKKTLRGGEYLLRAVPAIRQIIEQGSLVETRPGDQTGTKAMHLFASDVSINGDVRRVGVFVRETPEGRFQYSLNQMGGKGPAKAGRDNAKASITPASEGTLADLNLILLDENINAAPPATAERTGDTGIDPAKVEQFHADLAQQLQNLGLTDKVTLSVVERIAANPKAAGSYQDGLIRVALASSQDPAFTLNHEAIHALRGMRLLNDMEWATLSRRARDDAVLMASIKRRYRDLDAEAQMEEAVADMYARWAAGRLEGKGFVRAAFERLRSFIEAVRNALAGMGMRSADDIMRAVERGDVGRRTMDAGGANMDGERFSYENAPDSLMGFASDPSRQRGYGEQGYRFNQPVTVTLPTGETFTDEIMGLNAAHALERARRNWPDSTVEPNGPGEMQPRAERFSVPDDGTMERQRGPFDLFGGREGAVTDMVDALRAKGPLGKPDPTWKGKAADAWELFRMRTQDRYLPLKRAQRVIERSFGEPLADEMDAYRGEELMHGRIAERVDRLHEGMVRPLFDAMAEEDVSIDAFEAYLYARHAPERNAQIAKINPEMEGAGSGMTDVQAAAIMARIERDGKTAAMERLAARVDAIREATLDAQTEYGLISQERAAELRETYKHYVPLRGFKESEGTDPAAAARINRSGGGINVRGPEGKRAFGRRSEADSPLAYLLLQAEEAVVRGETNRVAQEFYRLAESSPNPDFWETQKITTGRRINPETGLVESYTNTLLTQADAPYTVVAKFDGKERRVTLNRENPAALRLADSMRRLTESQLDPVTKYFGFANRWLSAVNTRFNPDFVLPNMFRDIQSALVNIQDVDVEGLTAATLKHYPGALRASMSGAFNKGSGDWAKWYDEFSLTGAKTAYAQINDLAQVKSTIEKEFAAAASRVGRDKSAMLKVRRAGKALVDFVENANDGVENGVRLAAYRAAREAGLSEKQAGSVAKNLTVNFNRRGQFGPFINSLYLFYNASVQGNVRLLQALYHSKKARRIIGGFVVAGLMMEMLNAMLSADDDDGEAFYDKVPSFEKERNIIIMMPDGKDYIKIPVAYGPNAFWNLGRTAGEIGRRGGDRWQESAANLAATILGAFNPIGFSFDGRSWAESAVSLAMPSPLDPIVDLSQNKDFLGKPIRPEEKYGPQDPEFRRYFKGVGENWRALTDALNEMTGGNKVEAGAVSVSPEVLEYMANTVFGAAGGFFDRLASIPNKIATGDITVNDVPLARKVAGEKSPYQDRATFYERLNEVEAAVKVGNDLVDAEMTAELERYIEDNRRVLTLEEVTKEARKITRQISKDRRLNDGMLEKGKIDAAAHQANKKQLDEIEATVVLNYNRQWVATVYKAEQAVTE